MIDQLHRQHLSILCIACLIVRCAEVPFSQHVHRFQYPFVIASPFSRDSRASRPIPTVPRGFETRRRARGSRCAMQSHPVSSSFDVGELDGAGGDRRLRSRRSERSAERSVGAYIPRIATRRDRVRRAAGDESRRPTPAFGLITRFRPARSETLARHPFPIPRARAFLNSRP